MSPNHTPDPALRDEEEDDDAETVQMGGKELEELLSSVRPVKGPVEWLEASGLTRTPSDSLATHRSEVPSPQPLAAPAAEERVARWPWILAAVAVSLFLAAAAVLL